MTIIKRLSTAAIGFAFACSIDLAQAGPYFCFDERHYGELENAPNFGRPKTTEHGKLDHADAPRKCLKPEIRALLEKVEDVFGPVEVISTCRPGATIAGSGRPSRHASGNAVDFEAGSRKAAIIKWLVANNHVGGTMTYSDMSHIHIDFGPHFVALAAPSSGGGTRVASRATRGVRYGEGYSGAYDRAFDGGWRGYAREAYNSMRGNSYGYGRADSGSQYRSGYATIYR
jgi:Peptidase M15